MQITPQALRALGQGFQTAFLEGLTSVQAQWMLVAMTIASNTKTENYGWMKDLPGVREWIGQRVIHNLESANYPLTNKDWEFTIGVDRNDILDDTLGIYRNLFNMQGEVVARHPDTLLWQTLLAGFSTTGLDGQYFFDSDHIGYTAAGAETSYSNTGGGSGAPWFLMDLSRSFMKPLVMQKRQEFKFTNLDRDTDENVFMSKQFLYGADGRYSAGFGFYQLAYGSKSTLDATSYAAARVAMGTQRRPDGSVLAVTPTHLIVGPTNEGAARDVVGVSNLASGATNKWWNTAQIVVVPALG
jgi:phage major head subunit gpT-like protein